MDNLLTIRFVSILALAGLASCSTNYSALQGESDNLYFMASDAKVATEFAVQNNNRDNFKQLEQINTEEYTPESFSAKNVNPEYLAKYQSSEASPSEDGTVYFDESNFNASDKEGGDINIYNNFRGNSGAGNFNSFNMNPWMMSSMYMGGFSPWGMGGLYDPFWGSGFGFRPGFNLSLGMGFGFGSRFGLGFGNPWRNGYGMGYGMGYYDPFYSPYYGYGMGYGRPIIVIPGGSENQRRIVRGARPSRGNMATSGRTRDNVASPGTNRASARREAVSRTSTPTTRANSRTDFSRSQNDYYNARARNASSASAAPTRRSANSPAMSRISSPTSRDNYTAPSRTLRSTTPSSVDRSSAPSRSRYAAPSGNSSPSYNRSTSPQRNRTVAPSSESRRTYSTPSPSRSSSPSYSAPSRSSGSSSSGGAVRSSGGSSRRGN